MKRHALSRWLLAGVVGASAFPGCLQFRPQAGRGTAPEEIQGAVGSPAAAVTPYHQGRVVQASATLPVTASGHTGPWPPAHQVVSPQQPTPVAVTVAAGAAAVTTAQGASAPGEQVLVTPAIVPGGPSGEPTLTAAAITSGGAQEALGDSPTARSAMEASRSRPELRFQEAPGQQPMPAKISWQEPESKFPRGEQGPPRKSYVDLTAPPCFGHAPDYSWISGQVEYSNVGKEWRLRYASVDESDRFGGRVLLIENHHAGLLADGQYVRVEGHLVNPDAEGSPASYRVQSFSTIPNPNAGEPAAPAAASQFAPGGALSTSEGPRGEF